MGTALKIKMRLVQKLWSNLPIPRPGEETALDDSEISPEPALTEVHMAPMPNQEAAKKPSKLPELIITDMLHGVVHNKSESGNSHGSAHTPIKFKANVGRSIQQVTFYNGKKNKPNSSPIFRQEIRPVQKLWVLNTRFKSVQGKHKHYWKGTYLISKIHAHTRAIMKNSTTNKQLIPYLPLLYDAVKEWLTLQEQVT